MAGRKREVGTLLKSYHMKDPRQSVVTDTDNPKLEVQFSTEYSERRTIPWAADGNIYDVQDLRRELDENLVNTLHWADVDTKANEEHYVSEEYWDVVEDEREKSWKRSKTTSRTSNSTARTRRRASARFFRRLPRWDADLRGSR